METVMKVTKYAALLRARVAVLKEERVRDMAKFKVDFIEWKKALAAWIGKNYGDRVEAIKKDSNYYRMDFDYQEFFLGAPLRPMEPDDKVIGQIRALLRHLSITGQESVHVSTDDIVKFGLGKVGDEAVKKDRTAPRKRKTK